MHCAELCEALMSIIILSNLRIVHFIITFLSIRQSFLLIFRKEAGHFLFVINLLSIFVPE